MDHQKSSFACMLIALIMFVTPSCTTPQSTPAAPPPTAMKVFRPMNILPTSIPEMATLTTTLETGWVLYKNPMKGFALALPPTWKENALGPNTTEVDSMLFAYMSPSLIFWGTDLDPATAQVNSPAHITVSKHHFEIEISLDACANALITIMEDQPGVIKPIPHQRVKLAGRDAEKLRVEISTATNGNKNTVLTQYILLKDQDLYAIMLTTSAEQAEKYAPIFAQIAQSFQLTSQ